MVLGWGKKAAPRQETDEEMSMEEILASIRKYVSEDQPSPESDKEERIEDLDNANLHLTRSVRQPQEPTGPTLPTDSDIPSFFAQSETSRSFEARRAPAFEPRNIFDPKISEDDIEDKNNWSTKSHKEKPLEFNSTAYDPSAMPEYPVTRSHLASSTAAEDKDNSLEVQKGTQWEETPSFDSVLGGLNEKETEQVHITNQEKEGFLSDTTLSMASKSFAKLIDVSRLATSTETTSGSAQETSSALTLDRLMGDLARPLIQNWVDQHLPAIVEEMVSKEIDRITQQLGLKK